MTVLAASSAWIELLRGTRSPTDLALQERLRAGEVATTDIVIMEVLAGATGAARAAGIEQALGACTYLPQRRWDDALAAADVYRRCRVSGETPRQLADCLVAAVAVRNRVAVLHRDRDFDTIARHTDLEVITR
ncbi:MAG TPA: PIN domain-containing protein [Jatrophihabitans sp.]|jgi:hypothetical protein|uniref:type II toxin-antitoxin system VapC family toxin n=1 Tax=Jatrophihabitans sp. TaxID=1932789 RepID=UPI002E00D72E|nr:PIN domain-containing protein [Jatrophihabitans sp.]